MDLQSEHRAQTIFGYHRRTMHRPKGYAAGPETLDWDAQPDPWRTWGDAARLALPLVSDNLAAPYAALSGQAEIEPAPISVASVAALLELSFGLSAWKEAGPDRWAVRCNPSSGNLHPTEAYLLARDVPGIADGMHHYDSRTHALAHRCAAALEGGRLWLGLSSIHWREAWKYGERAFRYCQLDLGHAVGAVEAAAATLGWRVVPLDAVSTREVARLTGTDRAADFAGVEREEAELILAIDTDPARRAVLGPPAVASATSWHGFASRIDPRPMYHWPLIEEVGFASRGSSPGAARIPRAGTPSLPAPQARAANVILNRRSAQRYDRGHPLPLATLARILDAARPDPSSGIDLILFVHHVEAFEPGIYALPRKGVDEAGLRAALDPSFAWSQVSGFPTTIPLRGLIHADTRKAIRALTCHQAIAADASVTLCLLGDFATPIIANPWHYRAVHREAGRIGQRLYLEAEAAGLSGTGIGCFLDEEIHRLVGISDEARQALYHFAIGRGLFDQRIASVAAYPGRGRSEASVWP